MKREFLPGWLLMLALTCLAYSLSGLVVVGGKAPLEASALVVILGILIRNCFKWQSTFDPGIKTGERFLIWGIVLMGASLHFGQLSSQGPKLLLVIAVTMLASFVIILSLARTLGLSDKLALLLAVGTTICGGTAVAVTAPLIKARDEETSYAVATIALWGVLAILLYPALGRAAGASDFSFGVFAGTAIHSTPQVVGAGFIFSALAGTTATAVKLVRNCFMAPLALLIAVWYARKSGAARSEHADFMRAFPWFLFGFFVMSWLNSSGYFTAAGVDAFSSAGKFLIVLGMAAVGLGTSLSAIRQVGARPLLVGFFGAVVVALISISLILTVLS